MEEVELGGLEDDGENLLLGPTNDEYRLFDRDEVRWEFFAPVILSAFILTITLLLNTF